MKKKTSKPIQKQSKKLKKKGKNIAEDLAIEDDLDLNDPDFQILAKKVQEAKKLKPKDKLHYVNSREFEEEIRKFYQSERISEKLGDSIIKIANGLSYATNFINYSYKDEMIGDAVVKMFSALKNKKFRLDSGFSPFSYFTTIAFHAFINRIKKEKKHHEVLDEYKQKVYTETMAKTDEFGNVHIYIEPDDDNYNAQD
jgi:hypothetical protein